MTVDIYVTGMTRTGRYARPFAITNKECDRLGVTKWGLEQELRKYMGKKHKKQDLVTLHFYNLDGELLDTRFFRSVVYKGYANVLSDQIIRRFYEDGIFYDA